MSDALPPPPGIGAADWASTPQAVRILVLALQQQVVALTERVMALEERGRRSSRNSSQPPSSDPPSVPPRPAGERAGRARGGQPGHAGRGRPLLPLERVDRVVDAKPEACGGCGLALAGEDPRPGRHQVAELPRARPEVTEYRRRTLVCGGCGAAHLTGRCGVSHREAREILGAVCGLAVGLGSIAALERQVSAATPARGYSVPVADARAMCMGHGGVPREADASGEPPDLRRFRLLGTISRYG